MFDHVVCLVCSKIVDVARSIFHHAKLPNNDIIFPVTSQFELEDDIQPYAFDMPTNTVCNPAEKSHRVATLLLNNTFFDKSVPVYDLLRKFYDERTKDFDPTPICIIYPRRFCKTSFLGFVDCVFNPLPKIQDHDATAIKMKIASLKQGGPLLKMGLHPVIKLDMTAVKSISDLYLEIEISLEDAGLSTSKIRSIRDQEDSCSSFLRHGIRTLNTSFESQTQRKSRSIVLIDECDWPHRQQNCPRDLINEIRDMYGLIKKPASGISLLFLTGLTRMVGAGLSQLNHRIDSAFRTDFHGICGIQKMEMFDSLGNTLDDECYQVYI